MIEQVKKITADGAKPFASARGKMCFEEMGYVEEEYFFTGSADVYEACGRHEKRVIHAGNAYTNRFLVRRPENMQEFGGNVVVEILNATAGFDLDRIWVQTGTELMRNRAVYVGITSRPEMLDTLSLYDAGRYQELSWTISYERQERSGQVGDELVRPGHADRETGLFFDMLVDLTAYLRSDSEVIPTEKTKYFYLAGWSQSANYMTTCIRYFERENRSLFDGYFAAGNVHSFVTPLNQDGYGAGQDYTLTMIDEMPRPFIAVQTETENAGFSGYEARQEDSDAADFLYRIYEIAGATHDTKRTLLSYYDNDARMAEIGLTPRYEGVHDLPNDYPLEYPMRAMMRILFSWVREGAAPPHAERIALDADKNNRTDEFGNALGGVRTPFIEVPACTYHNKSDMKLPDGTTGVNPLFGYTEPFSAERLKELYGTAAEYESRVRASAAECVKSGFLLEDDREACVREAVEQVRRFGLE